MSGGGRRIAVVTGGSEGLGLELARELGRRGCFPALLARRRDRLDAAVAELGADGIAAAGIACDMCDPAAVERAAGEVGRLGGSIAWVVSCAGAVRPGTVLERSREDLLADLDTNLRGAVLAAKAFAPSLVPGGSLLFISSGFGLMGPAGYACYAAAKAGVIVFAEAIRRELRPRGIGVWAAVPPDIDTPGLARELASLPGWLRVAGMRGEPVAADEAARKILAGCRPGRFLVFIDGRVRLLDLVSRFLPRGLRDAGIDRLFPLPPASVPGGGEVEPGGCGR